jgi:uncharacterized protein YbjT (DUF2867 family)
MADLVGVLGATGLVGRVVAETLLDRGGKVRVIGRSQERLARLAALGAEPRTGDVTDARSMTEALRGASAVFALVPPNYAAGDLRAYHRTVAEAIAVGIQVSRIRYAVTLSSLGADHPHGVGPVSSLHDFEVRIGQVPGINVMHLRGGYFFENHLAGIPGIRQHGFLGGGFPADTPIACVAARDVGLAAVGVLTGPPVEGQSVREIVGPRSLTFREAAAVLGGAIGRPDMPYVQFPADQVRQDLLAAGMSPSAADAILEMMRAAGEGKLAPRGARTSGAGGTSLERWARDVFAPAFAAA